LGEKVLRDLANIDPKIQQSLLEKAITDNLVPARLSDRLKAILETLHQIKLRFVGETTIGGGKGTVSELLSLTPVEPQARTVIMAALTEHNGSLDDFWKKLETEKLLEPELIADVKLTFELGSLTRNHVPLVGELRSMFQSGELKAKRDLAKFDRKTGNKSSRDRVPTASPSAFLRTSTAQTKRPKKSSSP
jgi:hypothetical protein